ncbi:hypothetical protein SAMN05428957_10429 [Oryzisolibacter propanilivorax]|uniref:Uncharacterized protein n=1 Tax=Oryzisolibacter propanilivorax TaxID=1527607 RepID=A0A1G9S0D7_9BURK|nr:hypothetical protein [Oryzisolibacter propanilivorax]SDM29008.1 hypothetical protein SAMN05428957_10429 [Oryzisolibacter propanilivorax]
MHPNQEPSRLDQQLADAERDRARDHGHFNQYGMRADPRRDPVDHANPGTGDHARRFGAGGDPASYANRAGDEQPVPPLRSDASDAPAHPSAP